MKFIKYLIVLSLCLASTASLAQIKLTSEMVGDFIESIEVSSKEKNAHAFTRYLMPDAEIILNLSPEMGGSMKLTAAKYVDMLRQGWAHSTIYSHKVSDVEIVIADNGLSATISNVTKERVGMGGQEFTSEAFSTTWIVLDDGKPRASKIVADVSIY